MQPLWKFLLIAGVFRAALGAEDDEDGGDDQDFDPAELLKEADMDGDGKISHDEMFAGAEEGDADTLKAMKLFKEADTDGDGLIGIEEIPALAKKFQELEDREEEEEEEEDNEEI